MAGYSYPDKVLESFESQERVAGLISTPPSEPLQPGEVRSGGCEVPSLISFSLALSFNASNVSLLLRKAGPFRRSSWCGFAQRREVG
jgi:hypothetical protein